MNRGQIKQGLLRQREVEALREPLYSRGPDCSSVAKQHLPGYCGNAWIKFPGKPTLPNTLPVNSVKLVSAEGINDVTH